MSNEFFIGITDDLLSREECEKVIAHYEGMAKAGMAFIRQDAEPFHRHQKDDTATIPTADLSIEPGSRIVQMFTNKFWPLAYQPYVDSLSVLKDTPQQQILTIKIQKTQPGQGYHVWHFENDSRASGGRIMAFMTYLNTVEEGGETEFLYLGKRIKPVAGRTLLWPAGYTHAHRGNPPLSGVKYVLTGWVEFA